MFANLLFFCWFAVATSSCENTKKTFEEKIEELSHPVVAQRPPMIRQQHLGAAVASSSKQFMAGNFGTINLDKQVKSTHGVSVYFGTRVGEVGVPLVVKHMNNCRNKVYEVLGKSFFETDPSMANEFVLSEMVTNMLGSQKILPEMKWMSPLVPFTDANKDAWGFDWTGIEVFATYCSMAGGTVRTIVERRVGMNVVELLNKKMGTVLKQIVPDSPRARLLVVEYMQSVLTITRRSLELLRALHSIGIIHGDMHWGNLALADRATDDRVPNLKALQLIDLGMAAIVCGDPALLLSAPNLNPGLLAPWQFEANARRGFRDDVFRVIESAAVWLSFTQLNTYLTQKPEDREVLISIKKNMPYFDSSSGTSYDCFGPARLAGVRQSTLNWLTSSLGLVLQYARSTEAYDTPVDYDSMFEHMNKADAVLAEEAALAAVALAVEPAVAPALTPAAAPAAVINKPNVFQRMFGSK